MKQDAGGSGGLDSSKVTIYTDGGSRGNPGPAAGAYVLYDDQGKLIEGKGVFLGRTTNNVAEYTAVLRGLERARDAGAQKIKLCSDSELVVKQILGQYKVKNAKLRPIYEQCMQTLTEFVTWEIGHVYRESNKEADALVNQAMDVRKDVSVGGRKKRTPNPAPAEKPLRLGILISGGGRTMLNLDTEIKQGTLPAQICTVISSRSDVKGIERSRSIGIEPVVIRRKDYEGIEAFSDAIVKVLDENKVDLVIQAGWLCLWRISDKYKNRVMNIHPALLPSFGGKGMYGHHVHEAVLARGCKVSGCTVHFCTNEYDEGPIIVQKCCPVQEKDTPEKLAKRVFEQECKAYPEAIRLFAQKRLEVKEKRVKVLPEVGKAVF